MELDDITDIILDCAIRIHRDLGPGLFESVYETALERALTRRGLHVVRQHPISFEYEGVVFEDAFRADLFVEGQVIVEIKSIERLAPVHAKQVLTYLRLAGVRIGLLLNFGEGTLKDGLRRIVNQLPASASPRLRVNRSSP